MRDIKKLKLSAVAIILPKSGLRKKEKEKHGAAMFGQNVHVHGMQHLLESLVLLLFLGVNLYGVKAAGKSEDVIVMVKVLILSLFAVVGLFYVKADHFLPVCHSGGTVL